MLILGTSYAERARKAVAVYNIGMILSRATFEDLAEIVLAIRYKQLQRHELSRLIKRVVRMPTENEALRAVLLEHLNGLLATTASARR